MDLDSTPMTILLTVHAVTSVNYIFAQAYAVM